jgi:hypothetical protein
MPLLHKDYFELKAMKKKQVKEPFYVLYLYAGEQGINFPLREVLSPSPTRREKQLLS